MEKESISQDEIDALLKAMSSQDNQSQGDYAQSQNTENSTDISSVNESSNYRSNSKPLLSQEEIDALLSVSSSDQSTNPAETQNRETGSIKIISSHKKDVNIEKYDFTMPSRLSKEHLRALNALHSSYARALSSYLSISLRAGVEIECSSIEQMTYGEYISSLFDPTCVGVFSLKPLRGYGMLEISMPLVFPIIDSLLGGSGAPRIYSRGLTIIEEGLITKIIEKSLAILQESWQRSMDLKIRLERLENNPQFIQAATTGDPVVLILFDVKLDNIHNIMSLCFPFLTIQQALAKLKREEFPSLIDNESLNKYKNLMHNHINNIHLTISARYAPSAVTIGDLLKLKKGDIIKLANARKDEIEILVGGQRKFYGKPGLINGRRAVQIYKNEKVD
ncbi:MAG: flagellar motor switch protein FliM [bacterium]